MGAVVIHTSLDGCGNKVDSHDNINPVVQQLLCKNDSGKEEKEEFLLSDRQWWVIELVPSNAANSHSTGKFGEKAENIWDTVHPMYSYLKFTAH